MKEKYVNRISVSHSVYEMRIEFGVETPKDNNEIEIKKVADIRMSPQLAKVMRNILSQSIDEYEQAMGKLPDGIVVSKEA